MTGHDRVNQAVLNQWLNQVWPRRRRRSPITLATLGRHLLDAAHRGLARAGQLAVALARSREGVGEATESGSSPRTESNGCSSTSPRCGSASVTAGFEPAKFNPTSNLLADYDARPCFSATAPWTRLSERRAPITGRDGSLLLWPLRDFPRDIPELIEATIPDGPVARDQYGPATSRRSNSPPAARHAQGTGATVGSIDARSAPCSSCSVTASDDNVFCFLAAVAPPAALLAVLGAGVRPRPHGQHLRGRVRR